MKYYDGMGKDVSAEIAKLEQDNEFLKNEVKELATITVTKLREKNYDLKTQLKLSEEQTIELTTKLNVLESAISKVKTELKNLELSNKTLTLENRKLENELSKEQNITGKVMEMR